MICAIMLPTVAILAALCALLISIDLPHSAKLQAEGQLHSDIRTETMLGVSHPALAKAQQHG